jgi:uncharacterized protein with GYD domain
MPTYIQLLTLTPEGRSKAVHHPDSLFRAQESVDVEGVQVLGQYAVLGAYDFVSIIEAPDNASVARFSLDLGVEVGAHITTFPVISIADLEGTANWDVPDLETGVSLGPEYEGGGPADPIGR